MNLNTGTPWTELDQRDLEFCLAEGQSVEKIADFLCRDVDEVLRKIEEVARLEAPVAFHKEKAPATLCGSPGLVGREERQRLSRYGCGRTLIHSSILPIPTARLPPASA